MGNSQPAVISTNNEEEFPGSHSVPMSAEDFDRRWKIFLQSLDISSGHVKHVESLDKEKKIELLLSFEAKNPLCNVANSINLLKNLDWNQILNNKKRDAGSTLRTLLSSTEISLRTNSVDWVYEFLQCNGIEVLSDFMATCLQLLSSPSERLKRLPGNSSCNSPCCRRSRSVWQSSTAVLPSFDYSVCLLKENGDSHCHGQDLNRTVGTATNNPVTCGPLRQTIPDNIKELLKDCLHLSLRCLKTILNNQNGCKRAFEYPQVIRVLTFCLLHPSFMTKALALDLLTALCLIEGGHIKVLQAFDHLRQVMGEGLRFEMLLESFKHHESLDVEQYNIDFAVACVQFFNIVVHSPENINLRVYLQYELYLLGLDDVLKKLKDRAGDRLMQHIEAYLDNRVDCSLLLEDAEAKETAVSELERLEGEVAAKVSAAKEAARLEADATFKVRELELSELVESLRSRIRDLNVASWDRENAMKRRVDDLQNALHAARIEITKLQTALDTLKESTTSSGKICASMATSTHFDSDLNGICLDHTDHASGEAAKESKRSISVDTRSEARSIQPALSVDRASGAKHEPPDSTNCNSADRKMAPLVVGNSAPQKPIRKQVTVESPSTTEHPLQNTDSQSCPNSTVIRRLAAEAATTLSRLVSNSGANATVAMLTVSPPYFVVPPSGWPYHSNTVPQSETLFGSEALQKSLSLYPLSDRLTSADGSSVLDSIWYRYWERLSEPWLSAAQQTNSVFPIPPAASSSLNQIGSSHSFQWLVDLGLLPTNVHELSSTIGQSSNVDSLVRNWKLYQSMVQCTLSGITAQRLLWQLRTEAVSPRVSGSRFQSGLFDQIELALTQRFGSMRRPDWNLHTTGENRWFWISCLLRISLLWQLFPAELQRLTEGLSSLLAGCTSVLVNSKLPIILQMAVLFAQRFVANWTTDAFELSCLDALLDWNLSGLTLPASSLHPPVNGGPPAYHAPGALEDCSTGSSHKSGRSTHSFVTAFVHLVFQVAPNLTDWPAELTHIETASRVSIDDVLQRVEDMQTAVKVWHAISVRPLTDLGPEESVAPTRAQVQSVMQDVDKQLVCLRQAVESTRTVVQSTARWLRVPMPDVNQLPPAGWLGPLVRFAGAFKRCASELEKKRRNAPTCSEFVPGATPPHRHEHRRQKNEKSNPQHNGDKSDHRRRKHRTRQLDSDGIMDDILAGLTCQPLRTDIHTKRKDNSDQKGPS